MSAPRRGRVLRGPHRDQPPFQHQRLTFPLRRTRAPAAPRAASQSGKHRGQAGLLNDQNHVRRSAGSKPIERRRHWVASLVVGILVALLIAVGMFLLLVSNEAALSRTPPRPRHYRPWRTNVSLCLQY